MTILTIQSVEVGAFSLPMVYFYFWFCNNFQYSIILFRLNKRNLENGFKQFILRGMDGWMDVLHSRRHRRSLLFCAIAVSFSPIAVVFFSASAGLLCGKNGVILVHLKVRKIQLSVTLEKRFRTDFSAEKMVQKWRSNARAPLLLSHCCFL